MKRYVSDLNRIMALIYEDQPLPPPVPKEDKPFAVQNETLPLKDVRERLKRPSDPIRRSTGVQQRLARKKALLAYQKPQLSLDFQSLEKIRCDAEETMQKLITEDELAAEDAGLVPIDAVPFPENVNPAMPFAKEKDSVPASEKRETSSEPTDSRQAPKTNEPPSASADEDVPFGLEKAELRVLQAILHGEDVLRIDTSGQLLSVLVDRINEKLFDEFGDIVLENSLPPALIPDYKDDLKELFG